jgi:hypothetical protein
MWLLLKLRTWLLLTIALPLARVAIHRLAVAAESRGPSTRTARVLHQADRAITSATRRTKRRSLLRRAVHR